MAEVICWSPATKDMYSLQRKEDGQLEMIGGVYLMNSITNNMVLFDLWESYDHDSEPKMRASVSQYIRIIWIDRDAKNLLMFILISACFTFVEIVYGASANSLGK